MTGLYQCMLVVTAFMLGCNAFAAAPVNFQYDSDFHKDGVSNEGRLLKNVRAKFELTVDDPDGDISSVLWHYQKISNPTSTPKKFRTQKYTGTKTTRVSRAGYTFRSPGKYAITATAVDRAGNRTKSPVLYTLNVFESVRGIYIPRTSALLGAGQAEVDELFRFCRELGVNQLSLYGAGAASPSDLAGFILRARSSSSGPLNTAGADIQEIYIDTGLPTKASVDQLINLYKDLDRYDANTQLDTFDGVITEYEYWHDRAVLFPQFLGRSGRDYGLHYLREQRDNLALSGSTSFKIGAYLHGPTMSESQELKDVLDVFYLTDYVNARNKIYGNRNAASVHLLQGGSMSHIGNTEVRPIFQMTFGNGILADYENSGASEAARKQFLDDLDLDYLKRHYVNQSNAGRYKVYISGSLHFSYSLMNRSNATFYKPSLKKLDIDGDKYLPGNLPTLTAGQLYHLKGIFTDPNIDIVQARWDVVQTRGGSFSTSYTDDSLSKRGNKFISEKQLLFSTAGEYEITYTVTDSVGNIGIKVVVLEVQ